jgi:hypothetical protein
MLDWLKPYHIIWNSQSADSSESMPCGGHDIGLNVWVEKGDILFYIERSGSFDENNQMLKLGRVRVHLEPNPFQTGGLFRQELNLTEGCVELIGQSESLSAHIRIWVEVHRPVIHLELESSHPLQMEAAYESWRTADHALSIDERMACLSFLLTDPQKIPLYTYADVFEPDETTLTWFHRNRNDDLVFDKEVTQQGLDMIRGKLWNPQKDVTFGGRFRGKSLRYSGTREGQYLQTPFTAWVFRSIQPNPQHSFQIALHTNQSPDLNDWRAGLHSVEDRDKDCSVADRWQANLAWWAAFWERSWIVLKPGQPDPGDLVWQAGRNYQLFRFLMGCNAEGAYPTKFNGGLWTYDPYLVHAKYDMATPDFRQWGGGSFTAQNQRLLYWPLLKSGDLDLLKAQFDFYRNGLANAELRTKTYWGHEGASFTEQIENFGLPLGDIYQHRWGDGGLGLRQNGEPGWLDNAWCEDEYDTVFEFCLMILDTEQYFGADIHEYLPLIESCLTFFDQHYRWERKRRKGTELDPQGKLEIFPGSACETFKRATNSITTVSALRAVLSRLLARPAGSSGDEKRAIWLKMLETIPGFPQIESNGYTIFTPADSWERRSNNELPQLYPLFPYKLTGIGKPDFETALNTWRYGQGEYSVLRNMCWHQDPIFCARLGLIDEAAHLTSERLADAPTRFPAFWGMGHDWTPDLDHPGVGAIALQEMLVQTDGREIRLLPAWPKDWDVSFRLNLPFQTVVEGEYRNGSWIALNFTPESRRQDIVSGI